MSDPMMMNKGAPPSPGPATQSLKDNASIFNPVDIAGMRSPGHPMNIDPQKTTIRQYFQQNGVDVDGPVIQLVKFAKDQAGKANPINKMQNMAGSANQGVPVPPMSGGMKGPPPGGSGGGGLEEMMRGLGG